MDRGFLSISRTSCPFSSSSLAMERPTAPAPAMATRMSVTALSRCGRLAEDRRDPRYVALAGDDVHHGAGRVAPERFRAFRQQPAQHLVRRPAHRRDGGDAEPLVYLGAAGVVNPGNDPGHVE